MIKFFLEVSVVFVRSIRIRTSFARMRPFLCFRSCSTIGTEPLSFVCCVVLKLVLKSPLFNKVEYYIVSILINVYAMAANIISNFCLVLI